MNKDRESLRLLQLLSEHETWPDILREALDVEKRGEERFARESIGTPYFGWEWYEVHTPAPTLHKMVTEKVLDITISTRSATHYKIIASDLVAEVLEALERPEQIEVPSEGLPNDLFQVIVGHQNIKTIVQYAIDADKAVHLLFSGPPASAKTLFLMELARLPGSYYCLAQTTSQAGLANLLFTYVPDYLLIDEIDRLGGEHVGVLNSLMATGIISESKFGKTRNKRLNTKVFAAGIRINLLPKDLLSRFTPLKFNPYTEEQFIEVSMRILSTREEVTEELGRSIGRAIWMKNREASDIRQCIQVARLSGGDPQRVEDIIRILRA